MTTPDEECRKAFSTWYKKTYWDYEYNGVIFCTYDPVKDRYSHLDVDLVYAAWHAAYSAGAASKDFRIGELNEEVDKAEARIAEISLERNAALAQASESESYVRELQAKLEIAGFALDRIGEPSTGIDFNNQGFLPLVREYEAIAREALEKIAAVK